MGSVRYFHGLAGLPDRKSENLDFFIFSTSFYLSIFLSIFLSLSLSFFLLFLYVNLFKVNYLSPIDSLSLFYCINGLVQLAKCQWGPGGGGWHKILVNL